MRGLVLVLLAVIPGSALAEAAYTIKVVKDSAAPKELAVAVRKLLASESVQLRDKDGTVFAEVWFRREVPVKASAEQIKNGLTYEEIPGSTILGALRLPEAMLDYRKQKIAAGVYTLRFAQQPQTGDHAGTAPQSEFCLACPAAEDKKVDLLDLKTLQELSTKASDDHPSVWVLFPGTGATKSPKLVDKGKGHWVLLQELPAKSGEIKATMKIGLTLVGGSRSR